METVGYYNQHLFDFSVVGNNQIQHITILQRTIIMISKATIKLTYQILTNQSRVDDAKL